MCCCRVLLCVLLFLCGLAAFIEAWEDFSHHVGKRIRIHNKSEKAYRRLHRAVTPGNDGALRFEPAPYSRKLELNSSGRIHCKVAGGVAPTVQWFYNTDSPLPDGVTSSNGTLHVSSATQRHAGLYTCRAVDGEQNIVANITLDVVVSPKILEPIANQTMDVTENSDVWLHCIAMGEPAPTTHWDRNLTILSPQQEDVEVEGGPKEDTASIILYTNGSILIRSVSNTTAYRFGCTAGSAAGLTRHDLYLVVHPEGWIPPSEATGVGGKAVIVSISVAAAYMALVLALMLYCRRRRLQRRERGEKLELELVEGREKLVEEGDEKPKNGAASNGRLLHDKESGADNSESCTSKASKKSGQFNHLSLSKSLLIDQITLGRGEFGEVSLAKIDMNQIKKHRNKEYNKEADPDLRRVLIKALNNKQEAQLCEFRRQLELFSRVRHENLSRLFGLCNDTEPHCLLLEHTDWGDLKQFLISTRTPSEHSQYLSVVGAWAVGEASTSSPGSAPLLATHRLLLAYHLAQAQNAIASMRLTHRDVAARNCLISSKLHLKLSMPSLSRGPYSHEYYKMHDQVIPLRWLPAEAALEGEYSAKSDAYMYASTILEIYTKAELPFAKLNDNSVLERLKSGSLEWIVPENMPQKLAQLLRKCWSKSPTDRPSFEEICDVTKSLLKECAAENMAAKSQEQIDTIKEE